MKDHSKTSHILILISRYYADIAEELLKGATEALDTADSTYEVFEVSGALELPQALATAIDNGLFDDEPETYFHGAIALGCVIRGETSHYDIVAGESANALMRLAVNECIPIGNGILTVENHAQALVRASVTEKNKGRDAADACLSLINLSDKFVAIADDEADENV
jgi:6,7-dimethyl-8-ribityllumazine synthase